MNAGEGLLRIATVVRWCGWILCWLFAAIGLTAFFNRGMDFDSYVILGVCGITAAASVGISKAIAWVIEGFAKPKT